MGTRQFPFLRRALAVAATAAVMGSALVFAAAPSEAATSSLPTPNAKTFTKEQHFKTGTYIVQLKDPAAATYTGGLSGYPATHPADGKQLKASDANVKKYTRYLEGKQKDVADAVGADPTYTYSLAFNGFAAKLTAKQATQLSKRSDVVAVVPDEILHPQAEADYQFLGLQNGAIGSDDTSGLWEAIGGPDKAGEGIVFGDLDTGISPENPSFSGDALSTSATAGATPSWTGATDANGNPVITYQKADGTTFTGVCQVNADPAVDSGKYDADTGAYLGGTVPEDDSWTTSDCNTKLIAARYFDASFVNVLHASQPVEYESPRDGAGHGSHTASTAAGNYGVDATISGKDFGQISGMAPAAKVADYKVCWSGPDTTTESDDGCATADMVAAINQAVADGVDVLNFSIGGGAAQTTYSATDQAFLGAAAAGIFVATAAGNAGPGETTLDNASPWYTTVAASTIPSYEGTVTLGDGSAYPGATITVPSEGVSGDLVRADKVAAATFEVDDPAQGYAKGSTVDPDAQAALCFAGSLDSSKVAGKIVVCKRGVSDRVDKSAEVKRAGGIGMVLVNPTSNSLDLDEHSVPTLAVDAPYYQAIWDYAATDGATAELTDENTTGIETPTPQIAGFSSRGPVDAAGGDVLKPEISAPGVSIIADGPSTQSSDGSYEPSYEFMSGTSMATPHIAGLAALYLSLHPTATPDEIKSVMMTTAYNTVDADGDPVTDPFAQGAGEVDPSKFASPGLLYKNSYSDWIAYLKNVGELGDAAPDWNAASDLNLASISIGQFTATQTVTRTVTSTQAGTYTPHVTLPGFTTTVKTYKPDGTPTGGSTLTFTAAGVSAQYTVTFTRTTAPLDEYTTGSIDWVGAGAADGITVHSPVAIQPVSAIAPATATGTGNAGSTTVDITNGAAGVPELHTMGLAAQVTLPDAGTAADSSHSGGGSSADPDTNDQVFFSEVPSGTKIARFAEDAVDDANDYDLYVYQVDLDDAGNIVGATLVGQSATGSADEEVDLTDPAAGYYALEVVLYAGSGDFDLKTTYLTETGGSGHFSATAGSATAAGAANTVTLKWTGLKPNVSYLGIVSYGDTGPETVVTVDSTPGKSAKAKSKG
ncbi:S8 family serine peptidase [Gryllotalpicola ginsengisoli]|uniref:S8 family serine peptidase n=1 Tax=Gryllotalpicola ginsengisoli TaxID=444608 RepID=UPI0003B7A39D|nr:S8 family serine peptidase [Gryllotalpicola ginsengisoli]